MPPIDVVLPLSGDVDHDGVVVVRVDAELVVVASAPSNDGVPLRLSNIVEDAL
jgi:hypothetical protein